MSDEAERTMQAGWLDLAEGKVFCAYHPPLGTPRDTAILLCDPFGSDRMNLHLCYRMLALELARQGYATLRFDYPGTCDSTGTARVPVPGAEAAPLGSWLAAASGVADHLLAASGAKRLVTFGATLGATLALAVAARREDVHGALLWAPLANGRAFLREMAAFRAMTKANPRKLRPSDHRDGDLEAMGFLITPAFARELEGLDPLKGPLGSLRAVGIVRRNDDAPIEPFAERLRKSGVGVWLQEKAVVDLATLQDERAWPPPELLSALVGWCTSTFPERVLGRPIVATLPLQPAITVTAPSGQRVFERVVRFGPTAELFAVLTEPESRPAPSGVVLVNGGANHRVGINRGYVAWARTLAAEGVSVLRIDVRGLGDSPPPAGERPCVLYRTSAQDDVRAAIDWLHANGTRRVACAGLCAGGYHSLHTALADERVQGLVMLNPLRLKKVDAPEAKVSSERDYGSLASYGRKLLSPRTLARVLRGKVNVKGIAQSVGARISARVASRLAKLGSASAPAASWFSGALLDLTRRGTKVLVVLDETDAITERILEDLAPDRARLDATGNLVLERIGDADHIFTPLWSQEHLAALVCRTLVAWARSTP